MSKISNFEELSFFRNYDDSVLGNFLEIALQYLKDNVKSKAYLSAAQKLETDPATVLGVIEKLTYLLLESERLRLSEEAFRHNVEGVLPDPAVALLWEVFSKERETLRGYLYQTEIKHNSYSSLDWRLECMLASRSLQQQEDIKIYISINLKGKGVRKTSLSCDIPNLIHMTSVLESALSESRTSHVRKIQRSMN